MRVLLVDDHELIRCGVRQALQVKGHEVVAEAASVADALTSLSRGELDAAVVDVRLPDGSGMEVVKAVRASHPGAGIVVLTMFTTDEVLFDAMDAGANALVGKDASLLAITSALATAAADPTSFTAKGLTAALRRRMDASASLLTPREYEVLRLMAEGLSVGQIARRLSVSDSTAKTHAAKIYAKLDAGNRAQAVMTAVRRGILTPVAEAV